MSIVALGASRVRYETVSYFRSPDAVFFTFLFPLIMLGIFTAAFSSSGDVSAGPGTDVHQRRGLLPARHAGRRACCSPGVQNLAVDIAGEKGDGTLKRLGGTPLSPVSYFLGKIGQVFVTGVLQAALLLLVAGTRLRHRAADRARPSGRPSPGSSCSASSPRRSSASPSRHCPARDAAPPPSSSRSCSSCSSSRACTCSSTCCPSGCRTSRASSRSSGWRRACAPCSCPTTSPRSRWAGRWDLGAVAIALVVWLVIGLVLSRLTFRWIRKDA